MEALEVNAAVPDSSTLDESGRGKCHLLQCPLPETLKTWRTHAKGCWQRRNGCRSTPGQATSCWLAMTAPSWLHHPRLPTLLLKSARDSGKTLSKGSATKSANAFKRDGFSWNSLQLARAGVMVVELATLPAAAGMSVTIAQAFILMQLRIPSLLLPVKARLPELKEIEIFCTCLATC